ncbi:hypothetical protein [Thalassotalea castellviae]|uniref:Uncharacterized protein n=1 Tax=Thalassotalea castellviae TaxID=3075612 RepID=A0ABU2ZZX8_9GAMM|nr:hypothetical protein [Thalassotalea sp. W431]MDT0603489.1 hypothetical protein [Thalassotalea sp. W431]
MEKVTPVSTEQALKLCAKSVRYDAVAIRQLLEAKQAEAFLIGDCCFITRFEHYENEKELIVMCAEGQGLLQAGRTLKILAKQHNCTSARMHTHRKGMQRLAAEFGWKQLEVVYTMSL